MPPHNSHFIGCHTLTENNLHFLDPCDNVDCGHGTCLVDRHEAVCSCSPGYVLHNGACRDGKSNSELKYQINRLNFNSFIFEIA